MPKIHFSFSCTCGESTKGIIRDACLMDIVVAKWNERHSGDGHQPCSPLKAKSIRWRENEKKMEK